MIMSPALNVAFAEMTLSEISTEYGFFKIDRTSPDVRIGDPTCRGVRAPVDVGAVVVTTVV